MSKLDKLIEKVRQAIDEDVAAVRNSGCVSPPRFWEVLRQTSAWNAEEQAHLAECPRCAEASDEVEAALFGVVLAMPEKRKPTVAVYDIAADSDEDQLMTAFRAATQSGAKELCVRLPEGDVVPLLSIQHTDHTVEPCFVEGRTVAITAPGRSRQVVTPHGGVIIAWDDLRRLVMRLVDGGRTIEIEIGVCG